MNGPSPRNGGERPRVFVLNGSPRRGGNSARLAGMFAERVGGAVRLAHLYDECPSPCRACLVCESGADCPLDGVMSRLMERVAWCDCLVIASPLHFTSLTAPLVSFISRLQPWWLGRRVLEPERARSGVLLASGGSEYEGMFRPARSVAAAAFKVLKIDFAGMVAVAGADRLPLEKNEAAAGDVARLAERVLSCSSGS